MSQQTSIDPSTPNEPQDPNGFFQRGWEEHAKGDQAGAEASFKRAISLDSQFAEAYYGLGLIYKTQGRNEAAILAFQQAIDLIQENTQQKHPTHGVMLRNLAKAHIRMIQETQNPEQS